ncbi:MAG: hypothetical protein GTN39_00570 [Candidatus Aenigmarchaeota archaeon]|nr:hypothetical protein [Candidatus Aenigmarchaeota archaeon]
MRVSILIVVSAVVILVIALVLLTIFGTLIGNVYTVTGAQSQCAQIGRSTCSATGNLPANWAVPSLRVSEGGQTVVRSCAYLMRSTCGENLGQQTCFTCQYTTP